MEGVADAVDKVSNANSQDIFIPQRLADRSALKNFMINTMIQPCPACGSNRVVFGRLNLGDGILGGFLFTEVKPAEWFWQSPFRGVDLHELEPANTGVCLDCGRVSASLAVDVKEANKVLENWGTDAVKARLATTSSVP